jgi:hypothetical protein
VLCAIVAGHPKYPIEVAEAALEAAGVELPPRELDL